MRKFPLIAAVLPCIMASAQSPTPAQAESLVKRAVTYAKANGIEKLIQQTNQSNGVFHVGSGGEMYLFVYDQAGLCKAIGFNSVELVGKDRSGLKDPDGKMIVKEMLALGKAKGKGWVDYKYPDPVSGKVLAKTSYIEMHDGLLFGCGIYKR
ncbi:cache domain-containing protein [Geothrix sp. 21YS21S-2]|uniref:cache domain-containing protein n=1 Tax=Geothrix sp. 21YS21S-2 TaxID=3068893 RepID=UPI0027BA4C76|nr:cache domain-containing protein [Geothrix sp. 21YS21S-2]